MLSILEKIFPAWLRSSLKNRAWVFVALTILLTVGVRVRLRDMPLERDEGEYAYAGQLMLQGVPPYKEAYNMKLPGTYAAYAVIMAVFGQTPSGIHVGLALVNAATIWLMFLLGRKLLDEKAGGVAAVTYALMSLSPDVLGLAGHATHFVVLPAVSGILLLLGAIEKSRVAAASSNKETPVLSGASMGLLFAASALLGLAFVMKQHGVFFGVFGGVYLIWERVSPRLMGVDNNGLGSRRTPRRRSGDSIPVDWSGLFKELVVFSAGFVLPYLITCLVLWMAGVFPQFWFWTVTYGSKYAAVVPLVKVSDVTSATLRAVIGPNLVFWLLPWVGALMMWWDERLDANRRFLITALFLCSIASITVGFYFRQHYFILLLPVLALLVAVGVSRSIDLLRKDQSIELFLALGVVVVSLVATGAVLIGNGAVWFTLPARKAVEQIYTTSLFGDARDVAEQIKSITPSGARIAVVGSEPEIYFYSKRRSVTGHIYTYALMENHPYAAKMQEEMIQQIETARPEYVIYVNNKFSWLAREDSEKKILNWWEGYWAKNLELVQTLATREGVEEFREKDPSPPGSSGSLLLLLKRKN